VSYPVNEWLRYMRERINEINMLLDKLERLTKSSGKRKSKIIDKELYQLEVIIDKINDELEVRMYMSPKVDIDPKYVFLIYFTEFFPEISTSLIDPNRSKMYTNRIILSFKVSPEFFDIDMQRILTKINRFWRNLNNPEIRAKLDEIIPELYELVKKTDPESQRKLALLRMKVNDLLLYE